MSSKLLILDVVVILLHLLKQGRFFRDYRLEGRFLIMVSIIPDEFDAISYY
jgi:hypothetical protein